MSHLGNPLMQRLSRSLVLLIVSKAPAMSTESTDRCNLFEAPNGVNLFQQKFKCSFCGSLLSMSHLATGKKSVTLT